MCISISEVEIFSLPKNIWKLQIIKLNIIKDEYKNKYFVIINLISLTYFYCWFVKMFCCRHTHTLVSFVTAFAHIFTFHKSTVNVTGDGDEELRSFRVMSLYSGGTFDKNYNRRYQPIKFSVPASTKKVADPLVDPLKSFLSVWVSVLSSARLVSGGAVRRHHGPRLRRQPLWRVLRDLPPLPAQRCLQQHANIRLCGWEISRHASHQISILLALHQASLLLLDLGCLNFRLSDFLLMWL